MRGRMRGLMLDCCLNVRLNVGLQAECRLNVGLQAECKA